MYPLMWSECRVSKGSAVKLELMTCFEIARSYVIWSRNHIFYERSVLEEAIRSYEVCCHRGACLKSYGEVSRGGWQESRDLRNHFCLRLKK
jgi:hypothetical protein